MEKRDWIALLKLLLTFIPGKIYKFLYPDIWVVSEYADEARDNGYWLYKYIREHYPERKVFYPIHFDAPDYRKIDSLGNAVEFGSIKHYMLFWAARKYIGTTKYYGFPYGRICEDLVQWNLHGFKNVFINHGVARGYSSIVDAAETNYDLVIALTEKERNIMIEENGQSPAVVKALGFCRYDNLDDKMLDKKTIVIMPTWRNWLDFRLETDIGNIEKITKQFLKSDYYKAYNSLLKNPRFLSFIEQKGIQVVFYLHSYAQIYAQYFVPMSKNIVIAKKADFFVQDLLKQAAFLVTDYSSVVYDYAFMKKPMLYYQFDAREFAVNQYAEGKQFSYDKDGFGPVRDSENEVIDELILAYENGFSMEHMYLERVEGFFDYFDKNNCARNYEEIRKL